MAPLVLGACDIDPPVRESGSSPATPRPPEDAELVAGVVTSLVRARGVLAAAVGSVPVLADRLQAVREAHDAHLTVLVGAVPDGDLPAGVVADVPRRILPALAAVRRSEQRLLREVREASLVAASGDLARVLASVVASTSQHSAGLAAEVRA